MARPDPAATSRIRAWRNDALLFATECFEGFIPDAWQADALRMASRPGRKRLAMKACVGPGKSAILAILAWHRLLCFAGPGQHPKGAAVSITRDNLSTCLWPELKKWQDRSPILKHAFVWTGSRIYAIDHPETWFLAFRSFPKSADPESIGKTLSGLHTEFPFVLVDESGEIPVGIARAAEQVFSSCEDGLLATAGNPSSTQGMLYDCCVTNRSSWDVITITSDPDDPKRTPRVDRDWALEQIQAHGRDNPWVMSTILGLFPAAGFNQLIGPEEVEAAMTRHIREDAYNWSQKRLGVDVARHGNDRSVIFPRQGLAAFKPVVMFHQDTCQIGARVAVAKVKWGSELEFIDDSGHWGHGVYDNLRAGGHNPQAVLFEAPALNPRYANRRAEMWFEMVEWIRRGGCLPNIKELVNELSAPTYFFHQGRLQVEPKDLIKKRLKKSPDLADALALTFAWPDMPGSLANIDPALASLQAAIDRSRTANNYEPEFCLPSAGHVPAYDYDPFHQEA